MHWQQCTGAEGMSICRACWRSPKQKADSAGRNLAVTKRGAAELRSGPIIATNVRTCWHLTLRHGQGRSGRHAGDSSSRS